MHFGRKAAWIAGGASRLFGGLVGNQGGIGSAALLGTNNVFFYFLAEDADTFRVTSDVLE